VDDLGHRLDDLGGQAEPVTRELQFRSDVRSSERRLDPQVPPAAVVAMFVIANRKASTSTPSSAWRTSRETSSSGALKSRSVEKRPALPARNFLNAVPPLKTRSRSNSPCS